MRPKETGKKKIEIKKIQDSRSRAVTFSKRRKGLFNKAEEFSLTTGAQIGIVVQSPAGHFYTHGSGAPSFDSIVDRFLQKNPSSCDNENNNAEQSSTMMINSSTPIVEKDQEKDQDQDQDQDLKAWKYWLDLDVEFLNSEKEITMLMGKLEKLQNKVGSIMMARDKEFDSVLFV